MTTVLVTGGAGFMGSNFVRYLFDNYPDYQLLVLDALTYAGNPENLAPRILNDPRFSFWYGNVRNADLANELVSQSDVVVHFAAESHVARSIFDNVVFYETDVLGTQVIANAVLKNKDRVERFIHISSSEVYGTAEQEPMTEDHPLNPLSPYASAKSGADRLVYSYWATYKIPAIIIRPFNNYGPYQHLEKVIPRFITSAILDEPLTVHGEGMSARDWLYVRDNCEAIDRAMHVDLDTVIGEAINIGTGVSTDVLTIANMILERMNKPKSRLKFVGDRPGQVNKHISSVEKAAKLLNWRATTALEEGIEKTIDWFQKNRPWWEKLLWMRTIPIVTEAGTVEHH